MIKHLHGEDFKTVRDRTHRRWIFLAVLIDPDSRRLVGLSMAWRVKKAPVERFFGRLQRNGRVTDCAGASGKRLLMFGNAWRCITIPGACIRRVR